MLTKVVLNVPKERERVALTELKDGTWVRSPSHLNQHGKLMMVCYRPAVGSYRLVALDGPLAGVQWTFDFAIASQIFLSVVRPISVELEE